MKRLLTVLLMVLSMYVVAQTRTINGVVSDDSGPLPGVTVLVKGTTNGTITDLDGKYAISVSSGDVLVFSYISYTSQEIPVLSQSVVNITLEADVKKIDEVVVTALGIKRDKKALGYAVTNVAGENMASFSKVSPMQALSGQVAGLNISSSGSGAGGSAKVTIRGTNSLTGSNEPLYVIDGVPLDNSGGASGAQYGGTDYGNAANNINPDDIESISVLKGGAAAALYGSRGQNGVIMITTKKGAKQGESLGVSYGYQLQLSMPNDKPDFQNAYSQGSAGKYMPTEYRSWGTKMKGQEVSNFLGRKQSLAALEHPYDEYFQTGVSHNHSLSLNSRGDKSGAYFSFTNTQDEGIIPGNKIDKNSLTLRYDTKLGQFITIDAKANYIDQRAKNRPNLGGSPDNPVYSMWYLPRSVGLDQLKNYRTNAGLPVIWTEQYQTAADGSVLAPSSFAFAKSPLLSNPYWSENLNTNYDNRRRLIGFVEASLDLKAALNLRFDLNFKVRGGLDYYTDERQRQTAHNTYYKSNGLATMSLLDNDFTEENYDFLLTGGKRFNKFNFSASFGGNRMYRNIYNQSSSSESGLINKEGNYVIQNYNNVITNQGIAESEVQSLYGFLTMDWNNQVYLDVTARNDWTSTLSPKNWSIFYPSVSASWIASETFDLGSRVNLMKLRASYAAVGSGGNYSSARYTFYGTSANQFHGLPYGFIPAKFPNYDLKSEYTLSSEVGLNLVMFNNKLDVDLAYFNSGTENQIFTAPLAPSSGYSSGLINAGEISNSGFEAQIKGTLVQTKDLQWWAGVNLSYLWNEVKDLPEDVRMLTLGGIDGMTINAMNGKDIGTMMGTKFDRDENGQLILGSDNLPQIKKNENGANDVNQVLGKIYPDWMVGVSTGLSYKCVNLNVLVDGKFGHEMYSFTNGVGSELGVLQSTVAGRDEWEAAKQIYASTGVLPNMGYMVKGVKNGVLGDYAVDPQQYWQRVRGVNEMWLYDASYLRLRQISLSYVLRPNMHKISFLDNIALSASVNNLLYLTKKTDNVSPESSSSTGNASGIEIFSMPETMQVTFGVNVSF